MFKQYFHIAIKGFLRHKLYTSINLFCMVLTLTILLVASTLLQSQFWPTGVEGKSDRFLQIQHIFQEGKGSFNSRLGYKVITYLRQMKSIDTVAGVSDISPISIYQNDTVTEVMMRYTDAEYWTILDFKFIGGRSPTKQEVEQGRFLAVVNRATAEKLFASVDVIGKTVNVGGQQFDILGVVENVNQSNAYADLWLPVTTSMQAELMNQIHGKFMALLLAEHSNDFFKIKDEVQQVAKKINADFPRKGQTTYLWADSKLDLYARLENRRFGKADAGTETVVIKAVVITVLFMLLPILNLINLNAGRISERCGEIGVRKAFGASRLHLMQQFIFESMTLTFIAGLLALVFAKFTLWFIGALGVVPYLNTELNWQVFGVGFAITTIFGLLSSIVPAWKMARLDPVFALKGGV
ncbi:ABC transporter permease [Undibacterium flavidum]|uniref:ABC transporter permease n=1 Tax=Undibacterium flavidum TaxID=2762297 RepID=A0ABR6Y645_9BURK|nr:ABC transporter permease [Undibacterium flavidum]MBC3872090.1 ABC transporter permease [Undibacterium flavidum]